MRPLVLAATVAALGFVIDAGCGGEPSSDLFGEPGCADAGLGGSGSTSTVSASSGGSGNGGANSAESSSSGEPGDGGDAGHDCARCATRFGSVSVDGQLCKDDLPIGVNSEFVWQALNICACNPVLGECQAVCPTACVGPGKSLDSTKMTTVCSSCVTQNQHTGCGLLFNLCMLDGHGSP